MVSIRDYGIDQLPADQQLQLARQILESVQSRSVEMTEEEYDEEALRRDAELDANPGLALTEEQFWAQLERRRE